MKLIMAAIVIFAAAVCTAIAGADKREYSSASIIELLVTPDRFDGKIVEVRGFLMKGPEGGSFLSYTPDSWIFVLWGDAIEVTLSDNGMRYDSKSLERYAPGDFIAVYVTGLFRAGKRKYHGPVISKLIIEGEDSIKIFLDKKREAERRK